MRPGRVAPVALDDRRLDLVDVAADVAHPPLGAHPRRGGDVELEAGVGEDDRADVSPLDHPAAALGHPGPLTLDEHRPHRGVGGDLGDGGRDRPSADVRRRVDAVDDHAGTVDDDVDVRGHLCDRSQVALGHAALLGGKRHRSVHGPGVEVLEAEPLGQRPPDGALAGAGRAVDGDHQPPIGFVLGQSHDTPTGRPSS